MPGYDKLNLPPDYRAMRQLDASGFAWEFLRRNPGFRRVWADAGAAVRRAAHRVAIAARRITTAVTELDRHPLAKEMAPWGLTFRAVA